jgi:hypothetical protein
MAQRKRKFDVIVRESGRSSTPCPIDWPPLLDARFRGHDNGESLRGNGLLTSKMDSTGAGAI